MSPTLLIIEHAGTSMDPSIARRLNPELNYERQTWDRLLPGMLNKSQFRVIVANTLPDPALVMSFLRNFRSEPIGVPILAILPQAPNEELMSLVSELADDFVIHPIREQELVIRIQRMLGARAETSAAVTPEIFAEPALSKLHGRDAAFLRAVERVPVFARIQAPVLITGETGTGKELFAHAVHSMSNRRNGPFIPVDCGTLPEQLAENELFGHCRGAFTDAHSEQKGLAAMAQGGLSFSTRWTDFHSRIRANFCAFCRKVVTVLWAATDSRTRM